MKQKNCLIALIFLSIFHSVHSFDDFDLVGFDGECLPDGTGVQEVVSAVDVLIDAVSAFEAGVCSCIETATVFSACNAQPITTATTISNPGTYCIDDTISGNITITASNVMLDLNGYTIQGSITIASNVQRVTIANGIVDAQGAMDGIAVESGTSLITIDRVRIKNAIRGLSFTQSHENQVRNCTFTQNTTGMFLDNATEISVRESTALENVHAGFDLISSSTNCFIDCKAVNTGFGNQEVTDNTVAGFISSDGHGNVFERCVANATQALSTTDLASVVAGFALRGSEECTKIIDSESANAQANLNGVTVPKGIFLEDRFDMLISQTMEDVGFTVNTLDWSSDGIFLASGSVLGPNELRIYEYDRQTQVLKLRASADATLAILSVKWSPSGQYIAVGMDATGATAGQLIIFAFDRTTFSLKQVAQVTTGVDLVVNSVDWSFDEQYVAFGTAENTSGDEVFVYKFDRVNTILTFATSTPVDPSLDVTSVNWSHDGQFLAVATVDVNSEVLIFYFNRAVHTLTEVANQMFIIGLGFGVNAVRWSASDLFLAVGTTVGLFSQTQIYRFNKQTFDLSLAASNNLGPLTVTINGLSWAPNEEYLAIVSTFIINEDQVHILHFDKDAMLEKVAGASLGVAALSVDWSPDGQAIAVSDTILNQQIIIYQGLVFPTKNIVQHNVVYSSKAHQGMGISGSSIANALVGNVSYNNKADDIGNIFFNYVFSTNVFNPLFQNAPSDLQNISLDGCEPIAMPHDQALTAQQIIYKIKNVSQTTTSLIEEIVNKIDQLDACDPTAITNANTTITQEGRYCVAEPITGTIAINASNVDLDLNGYEIGGGVTIGFPTPVSEVKVVNGTVLPSMDNSGLFVSNSHNVLLKNILATGGGGTGFFIELSHNVRVINCRSTNNEVGLRATDSYNVNVSDTIASNNSRIGFELASSYTNCFIECKALSTGFENTTTFNAQVFGFVSNNGSSNIFERCIANATQALSATDSNSLIAGFALRGTEKCTKIIDSESANTQTNASGVTVPYGILLEGTLSTIISVTGEEINTLINSVNWSPDGNYVAIGTASVTGDELRVYAFNRSTEGLIQVAGEDIGTTINEVAWSPDQSYIAIGAASGDELLVYSFDRTNNSLIQVAGVDFGLQVNSVSWAPDELYLAVGADSGTNEFRVYSFDRVSNSLMQVDEVDTGIGSVQSVDWSPDGQYIAIGAGNNAGDELRIYDFNRSTNTLTQVAEGFGQVGATVNSVNWSSDGQYIAVGVSSLAVNELRVYRFERGNNSLTLVAFEEGGTTVLSVNWSLDGQYIAVGLSGLAVNELRVYRFDRGTNTLTQVPDAFDEVGTNVNSVDWSPDGQYLVVGLFTNSGDEIRVYSAIQFPEKNVITNNTVYCNSGAQFPSGVGISGSSICNMIIGNSAYSNPIPTGANEPIVGSNYQFVTNVFNQLFGQAPSALQNISLDGCDPIAQPLDQVLIAKQIRYKLCNVESALEEIISFSFSDIVAQATLCSPTNITSAQTISTSGTYRCCQNIMGDITIAASDVVLDLNKYKITGGIIVNSNLDQITLRNGVIENGSSGDGILVNSGATNITIENITVKNTIRGIHFDTVVNGLIDQVTLVENTTGLQLENSYNISVFDATAKSNLQAGYELLNSTTCCILDSKALSTGLGNTNLFGDESNVYGFVLNESYGNIIERCIANATQNLSATSFDTVVAGFALLGTGTQCNKIIGCEAGNTEVDSNEESVGYGIYVDHAVSELEEFSSQAYAVQVNKTSWSSDGKYFAVVCLNNTGADPQELAIYTYNYETNTQTRVAQFEISLNANAVDWSPAGDIIAVGDGFNSSFSSQFFLFDRINNSLKRIANFFGSNTCQSMDWSFDGLYCVRAAAGGGPSGPFQIFQFDPIAEEVLSVLNMTFNSKRNEWSPDGRYIAGPNTAVGTTGLQIFRFDRATNTVTQVNTFEPSTGAGTQVTVTWSPDQKYVVMFKTAELEITFFEFDEQTGDLASAGTFTAGSGPEIGFFSSDGAYLAVAYAAVGTEDEITVYRVIRNGTFIELEKVRGFATGASVLDIQWSPDGQLLSTTYSNAQHINQGLLFSSQNLIVHNTVYCTGANFDNRGFGISGSSIANCIIQNNSFNNPFAYAFVTNEFNQLFGIGPSLVQNIGIDSCEVITTPQSLAKKMRRAELLLESLIDNLL